MTAHTDVSGLVPDVAGPLGAPPRLRRWGSIGWAVVGVFLGFLAVYVTFAWLAGLVVPIALALVLCVLTLPLTNWLDRHMPRGIAVLLVLLVVFAVRAAAVPGLRARDRPGRA